MSSKIGIGITTYGRSHLFVKTLAEIMKYSPRDAELYVAADVSGVAKAKNICLKQLVEAGCEHIFLFDDDTFPISKDWWKPYVESKEPHLMYQFKLPGKPASDMQELYRDDEIVAYTHTRGAMIYINRKVLDVVGGFDEEYGTFYEHPDFTNRVFNAGLTSHRAMDVVGSDKLLYCLDQDAQIRSSIPKSVKPNHALYRKNKLSKEYKEFR